jgi:hypothetical protein
MFIAVKYENITYTIEYCGREIGSLHTKSDDNKHWSMSSVIFQHNGKIKYGKPNGWNIPVKVIIYFDNWYRKMLKMKAFI